MTSSMLAGERRWASSRRGGMTVLGKVSVPKPLNLPSQKLENHGVDPNVEIVPKGSLSWGSRPSSSTSNPWGSSATPNADGTTGSPSHPSGRQSGGGFIRPSTAGSDNVHEHAAIAWGLNSRPSSASGVLTSNQSSLTSSRPHSAETRPGSSHLSRFAEPVFDNSVAWGPNATADKLLMPTKNENFSLSSGDFPTLGSEKDNAGKSSGSHDNGSNVRSSSATDRSAPTKERDVISQADKSGTVNTWRRDETTHVEDGVHPSSEKRQGEPQQYLNPNVPPHFDAWCGPPMNASAGVWYRGAPGGHPYPPVAHGGFPMEQPFPHYRPQFPPALANSQPGHPPGVGPRGPHPKNADFYRPQMHDAFIRPGMPIRHGFYPGPVPYDGYYGPPMAFNPNERDIPFMGMPPGPPVHMYPAQNPSEPSEAHFRAGGNGLGSVCLEESHGPYRVLRKHENEGDVDMEENVEPTTAADSSSLEKGDRPRSSSHKNGQGEDNRRNKDVPSRRNTFVQNPSSRNSGNRGHSSDSVIVHSPEARYTNAFDHSRGKRPEIGATSFQEMPQVLPGKPEDSSLLQKIEGLNAKVRCSDVREDTASGSLREEQKNRRARNVVQSREDNHSKGRINNQDAAGWGKNPPILGSEPAAAAAVSYQNPDHTSFQAPGHGTSIGADEKSETKNGGESSDRMCDSTDGRLQRAKTRELAKQRAIQLQKEEEERIREQKAKALAKLEELNRRTLAADGTPQNVEKTTTNVPVQQDVGASQILDEPANSASKNEVPGSALDAKPVVSQMSKTHTKSTTLSRDAHAPKNVQQEPVVSHGKSLPLKQNDATNDESEVSRSLSREKRAGQRRKPSGPVEKSFADKSTLIGGPVEKSFADRSTLIGTIETPLGVAGAVSWNPGPNVAASGETGPGLVSSVPNSLHILPESTTHQRQKTNRSGKTKHNPDPATASSVETNLAKVSTEDAKSKSSRCELDPDAKSVVDGTDAVQPKLEQNSSLPNEEAHGRANNQHKPKHSHGKPRNAQANTWSADRFHGSDAVIWAPVRAQNKTEPGDEQNLAKSNDKVQSNLKNKRAEIERYVPKPVVKELLQQGNIQQPETSSPGKGIVEEMAEKEGLFSQPAIPGSGTGDSKQIRQVRSHGPRRQRGPTELHHGQGFQQGPTHQKSMGQQEASTNVTHEWDPSDGWYMPECPTVNEQGVGTDKGKKQTYKDQRRRVNDHDVAHTDVGVAETDKNFVQINQNDRPVSSKENRSSHWQPKPQPRKGGSRHGGGQNASSEVKKGSPEESFAEYKNVREAPRRERPVSSKGRPHSPNQSHGHTDHVPSDPRKNVGQNNWQQRQDSHYKYQPVWLNKNNNGSKPRNSDAPADGSRSSGGRGGGGFYGRQSGGVRVEAGYE